MNAQELVSFGITPKFPYQVIDAKNEVELSIGIENRVLYIAFLGSVSLMDWKHNFMFWKKPYKEMEHRFFVHAGFLKIYKIVRPTIREWLFKQEMYDEIVISGHSLGGAVATLCHEDVMFLNETTSLHKCVTTFTSGSPRVFSAFFSKIPRRRCEGIQRLVYRNDGIPTLPPAVFGYKHVGVLWQCGDRKVFPIFHPSFIYHHDTSRYADVFNTARDDTVETNYLYSSAVDAYQCIFGVLGIVAILCTIVSIFN